LQSGHGWWVGAGFVALSYIFGVAANSCWYALCRGTLAKAFRRYHFCRCLQKYAVIGLVNDLVTRLGAGEPADRDFKRWPNACKQTLGDISHDLGKAKSSRWRRCWRTFARILRYVLACQPGKRDMTDACHTVYRVCRALAYGDRDTGLKERLAYHWSLLRLARASIAPLFLLGAVLILRRALSQAQGPVDAAAYCAGWVFMFFGAVQIYHYYYREKYLAAEIANYFSTRQAQAYLQEFLAHGRTSSTRDRAAPTKRPRGGKR